MANIRILVIQNLIIFFNKDLMWWWYILLIIIVGLELLYNYYEQIFLFQECYFVIQYLGYRCMHLQRTKINFRRYTKPFCDVASFLNSQMFDLQRMIIWKCNIFIHCRSSISHIEILIAPICFKQCNYSAHYMACATLVSFSFTQRFFLAHFPCLTSFSKTVQY